MIRIVMITLIGWSGLASAQMDVKTAKAMTHNFSLLGSMNAGGFAFGAGYEFMYDGATGVGAQLHSFSKKTATASSPTSHNGLMIFGASLGHHFFKGKWDLAFTPSFNLISIDSVSSKPGDTTTMGPGMGISLVWLLTERFSAGFEYSNYWVWFNEDFRGNVISDMAAKLKVSF